MAISRIAAATSSPASSATWSVSPAGGTDTEGDIVVVVLAPSINNTHIIDHDLDWVWITNAGIASASTYQTLRGQYVGIWRSDGSAPASYGFTWSGAVAGLALVARYRADSGDVLVQVGDAHPGEYATFRRLHTSATRRSSIGPTTKLAPMLMYVPAVTSSTTEPAPRITCGWSDAQ